MKQLKRKKLFVDAEVQTAIIYRVLTYWTASLLFILLPLTFFYTYCNPDVHIVTHLFGVVGTFSPMLLMMFVMLPLMVYDVNRFSNRFVGPIYRVRQELKKFEQTGQIPKIRFRERDYWQDLAEQLNGVSARIQELENELNSRKEADELVN